MGVLKRLARRILHGRALTTAEAAVLLDYDESDIPSLVRQGILTPIDGKGMLFDRVEVEQVKREQEMHAERMAEYYRTSDFLNGLGGFDR